jgi:soluble lytic murein transglycosylase
MLRKLALLIICAAAAYCGVMSYDEVRAKPKSIAKDYYIYRLLTETNISAIHASLLYDEVSRMNPKLQEAFAIKTGDDRKARELKECQQNATEDMSNLSESCVEMLVIPQFVLDIDNETRRSLARRLRALDQNFTSNWVAAMSTKDPFRTLLNVGGREFLYVFTASAMDYRRGEMDKSISEDDMRRIAEEKNFGKFVKTIVINDSKFKNLPSSLLFEPQNVTLSHEAAFFLGLNAARYAHPRLAHEFFGLAEEAAFYKQDKDKSLFWQYLMSRDNATLDELATSYDNNIYSLYAKERTRTPVGNLTFYESKRSKPRVKFDTQDPFAWRALLG